MRIRPATGVLISGLVLTLAASLGLSSTAGAAAEDRRAQQPSAAAAQQALADAQDALSGTAGKPTRDATMALRDLHQALPNLDAADRKTAESILSRPTDPGDDDPYTVPAESLCGTIICLHWVESSEDAVALTDVSPPNGTPDYVDLVLQTMESVHNTYVGAGYKAPKPDGTMGGNAQTDVYLANIGIDGLYGYCDSDEPQVEGQYDYWTYCVLDNDFSATEFPGPWTPTQNMQVTAAHEYFHAVQGAYDWYEDRWLMEGTATWVEDELFDDVNQNRDYLPSGQLGVPWNPLDGWDGGNVYGNWIFFRFLTEQVSEESGGIPSLIRTIWRNADSTNGVSNDQYSLQAVSSALADAGYPFPAAYADFAMVNREPWSYYEEGAAGGYRAAPLSFKPVTLTPARNATTWGAVKQNHLTNDTVRFKPSKKMKAKSWRLKVQVDLAPKARGSKAVVTVFFTKGKSGLRRISLNGKGDGSVKVLFSSRRVAAVELTIINASERTDCWIATSGVPYSCYGIPKDDNLKQKFRAIASR